VEAGRARHPAAVRPVPLLAAARHNRRPFADLTMKGLNDLVLGSMGDERAWRTVTAALAAQGRFPTLNAALPLTDIGLGTTDNVAAMYRPAYQAELVELISWGTPLIDALRRGDLARGDWPNKVFTVWEKTPEVREVTGTPTPEKQEIHSAPAKIGTDSAAVHKWAGGNDLSQELLDFGSPDFVEQYVRAAGQDYALQVDTFACTTLLAAATPVTTVASDDFITIVGKLVSALSPATTPPGGLFLAMAYDVGAGLISVKRDDGPAFWDGSVSFGSFMPSTNVGGLTAFVDPNLPASTYLLGHRQGATWYAPAGVPFRLTATNVGLLGLDIAVYGYGALGVQYPGAFVKTTNAPGPTAARAAK
jgi:hypothetical protein